MSEIFDQSKFICHFIALSKVNESQFSDYVDPIVVYKDGAHNKFVQVNVLPFSEQYKDEMSTKTFAEKLQFYKRKIRSLKNSGFYDTLPFDTTKIVSDLHTSEIGTYNDFYESFQNPASNQPTIEEFFSAFMDLEPSVSTEFQNSFNASLV